MSIARHSVGRARKCVEPETEPWSFNGFIIGYTRSLPFICLLHNVAEPLAQRHPLDFGSRGALNDTQSSLLDDDKLQISHADPAAKRIDGTNDCWHTGIIWCMVAEPRPRAGMSTRPHSAGGQLSTDRNLARRGCCRRWQGRLYGEHPASFLPDNLLVCCRLTYDTSIKILLFFM